ncbi:glycosyltransferase family 9 protein [Serratia quinivorans]|uniref:glycosyltransferase family 9 protein n=1 Tax=Serratia quinivorans TaxID=137545 RepID=UPI0039824AE5
MKKIYVYLNAAMGDNLYLLAACRAIKKSNRVEIIFISPALFVQLARACPHVSEVWQDDALSQAQIQLLQHAHAQGRFIDFTGWNHALTPVHMIDSFLAQVGIEASASDKQLDLVIPPLCTNTIAAFYQAHQLDEKQVLLVHPNIGHPNRSWSQDNWFALTEMWLLSGWQVIFIGSNTNSEADKTMPNAPPAGVINAIDHFSPLETVALMQRASMLVSCDSGPVMLAAATEITIAALYSTVSSQHRLPFRHGEAGWNCLGIDLACANGPCARLMANEAIFTTLLKRPYGDPTPQEFANWCVNSSPFKCLQRYSPSALFARMAAFILQNNAA